MDKETRLKLKTYVFTASLLLAMVVVMLFTIEKSFEKESAKAIVGSISNCFTVPGVLFAGIGGLSLISRHGGFDGITYSFKNFGLHNLIGGAAMGKKKAQSFYEYKTEKDEKGRKWLPNFLYVGLVSIGIALMLLVVWAFL